MLFAFFENIQRWIRNSANVKRIVAFNKLNKRKTRTKSFWATESFCSGKTLSSTFGSLARSFIHSCNSPTPMLVTVETIFSYRSRPGDITSSAVLFPWIIVYWIFCHKGTLLHIEMGYIVPTSLSCMHKRWVAQRHLSRGYVDAIPANKLNTSERTTRARLTEAECGVFTVNVLCWIERKSSLKLRLLRFSLMVIILGCWVIEHIIYQANQDWLHCCWLIMVIEERNKSLEAILLLEWDWETIPWLVCILEKLLETFCLMRWIPLTRQVLFTVSMVIHDISFKVRFYFNL